MIKVKLTILLLTLFLSSYAQTFIYRDTIPVFESGNKLLNPWAGGINFSSFSQIDLNFDGKLDLLAYDKVCGSGGKLKTFINVGISGIAKYIRSPELDNQLPPIKEWALLFDYNNDNKQDLFTYTTGGISVFKNTSSGNTLNFSLVKSLLYSNYNPAGTPNLSNIYSNPVGLPGIGDVDNDGDLDILTYSIFGVRMEYHKNMSMELYGNADSLIFNMVDDCWGDIQESNCELYLDQCPFMRMYDDVKNGTANKVLHSGSCIMCFDRDSDGDQELILGDVSCSDVFFVENTGTSSNNHIGDTTHLYPNYPNKGSTERIKLNSFPCTYYLDIDNDGFKDLIASPNAVSGAENFESVWYYKNTSITPTVNFSIQQKNFLQDGMIEVGEGAYPVLFDADGDGLKDLIIGNLGYYTGSTNKSKLAYYKNIGTLTQPSFSLITRDYQSLSIYNIYSMAPTFGDIDNDGDEDLMIGDSNGQIHYFENSGGAGNQAIFSSRVSNYQSIDVGNYAYPQLYDANNDGTLDLLIGSQNGKIALFRNGGSLNNPSFALQTSFLGGIDVRQANYLTGFSMPYMYKDGSTNKLLVGSEIGSIFLYDNIDGNLGGTFNKVDDNLYQINEGPRCAPFFEDITNDGLRDLFLGNYAGGLAFFNSNNINNVNVKETLVSENINVFPNPAYDVLNIKIENYTMNELNIKIIDVLGREYYETSTFNKLFQIDTSPFSKGLYFVVINDSKNKQTLTKKIILK